MPFKLELVQQILQTINATIYKVRHSNDGACVPEIMGSDGGSMHGAFQGF